MPPKSNQIKKIEILSLYPGYNGMVKKPSHATVPLSDRNKRWGKYNSGTLSPASIGKAWQTHFTSNKSSLFFLPVRRASPILTKNRVVVGRGRYSARPQPFPQQAFEEIFIEDVYGVSFFNDIIFMATSIKYL
jgi:hypothetical protein